MQAQPFISRFFIRFFSLFVGLILSLVTLSAQAFDVNQATLEQLQQVKGIGPKTAQLILQERERAGPYVSYDDLALRVKGIGPKKLLQIQESGLKVGVSTSSNSVNSAVSAARKKP
ncbi:ComEA family DNA-binding protein [Alcaligenes endophyticus]|uniref:DUF655 domain-containing protein n=1 Tax=Alcaligenes endophyticus TaxID=1929088 RepID=A0ABT8EI44_9BURK|nr:DUF655 domain-containing protein [Alcaligenes endophyticus]MCX5592763.1 DUF655 domain-containing protein [Alcaligenes endophyticus]MDN4120951.1 DUF655 domain-containing protein [Alcaligenes endophyticus]